MQTSRPRIGSLRPGRLLILAASASTLWATAAWADVGVSKNGMELDVYGILDIGLGHLDHSYSPSEVLASTVNPYNLNSSPKAFSGLYSGGASMSRLGIKGDADLGNGFRAFFKLESAVDVNSGDLSNNGRTLYNNINGLTTANAASAIDGQPFSRNAYIGLSHTQYGSVEIGRTSNFSLDQVAAYDPLQAALLFSPLGFSGAIGGGLGATENTRLDNSIRYENEIDHVHFGAQYKVAGSKGNQAAGSGYVAMLGYDHGPFSVEGTYSQTYNTVAWATTYSNVVAPNNHLRIENTTGYMVSGLYKVTPAGTLKIGYESSVISAPSDQSLGNIQSYYGLYLPKAAQIMTGTERFNTIWIGGDYRIIENLDVSLGYYNVDTFNKPELNKQYRSNIYSALADYKINKYFDVYAGAMMLQYDGIGLDKGAAVDAFPNNAMYGTGVRFRF